jgi:hypothetical protein
MRALVVALLLVTIALVALPTPAGAVSPSPCTTSVCKASITSTIATNSWGVTTVTDEIVLNSSRGVSQLMIGIPTNVSGDLRFSQATDDSGTSLQISPSTNQSYTALTILFPTSATRSNYNFTLTTVYWGLLTYSQGSSSYTFSINPFPVIDDTYNATASTMISNGGGWTSPTIAPPNNQTSNTSCISNTGPCASRQLKPFDTTVWTISFSSASSQNLFTVSAGRTITVTPSDSVQVTDAYNLTNLGPTVSSIPFIVPKGVSGISATYVLGLEIDQPSTNPTTASNPDGTSTVTFTPVFGSLPYNQTVKVKISYALSPSTYLATKSLGSFTLNFALFNNVQFYAPTLQTKIATPMGFRLNSVSGQVPTSTGSQIVFQASTVSPSSNLGFSMTYQLDPFRSTVSPLTWASLIELALAGSVIAVWRGTGAGAVTGVPVQLITKFADLYDEKSSISMESDKMEEDVARGSLNRYDYRQRRRSQDRHMAEIDRALASVKADLAAESPRYADMIKKLERAEAELQVIRTTSVDLKNQNRTGKISRDLYDSLNSDLIRRKEKAQQTIDTIIINLREEIR